MEADIASQAVGLTSTDFSIVQLFLRADIIVKSVIIILIAASVYSFWNIGAIPLDVSFQLVIASSMALCVGLISIHWLIRWLRQGRLWWFSVYCAFIGIISIAGSFLGII